jgi:hypothetical protein
MPPAIQAFWNKLNANEKLVAQGALVTIVAWLISIFTGGAGLSFVAGIAVLVVYWLKYAPGQQIAWPMPVATLVLIAAGLSALFAVLGLLGLLSFLSVFGFIIGALIATAINVVGSVMMALGAWREYQAMPKTTPPAPPPAPSAPPPSAPPPAAPPPAAPSEPPPPAAPTS